MLIFGRLKQNTGRTALMLSGGGAITVSTSMQNREMLRNTHIFSELQRCII